MARKLYTLFLMKNITKKQIIIILSKQCREYRSWYHTIKSHLALMNTKAIEILMADINFILFVEF